MSTAKKLPIINCHTHIITSYGLPNGLFLHPLPMVPLLRNKVIRWVLVQLVYLLGRILYFFTLDKLWNLLKSRAERALSVAQMLDAGKGKQKEIFEYLRGYYSPRTKFVVLSLDTEFMGKGKVPQDFEQQLDELSQIQKEYSEYVFPFVHAEPRRDNVTALVKDCIENRGFKGIKIYPPFGIHPNDKRLKGVYDYAVANNIPITGHCTPDGMKGKNYKIGDNIWADPDNYLELLKEYPSLKLCLAHFGGDSEWKKFLNDPWDPDPTNPMEKAWVAKIIDMIKLNDDGGDPKFPNLFVDVSYTSFNPLTRAYLKVLLTTTGNQRLRERVLFGSDFYVLQTEISERAFGIGLRGYLGEDTFDQIARINPTKFLDL